MPRYSALPPPPEEFIVKRHPNGCISYRDGYGDLQIWRPNYNPAVRSGHIYILTNAIYQCSDMYRIGFTVKSKEKFQKYYCKILEDAKLLFAINALQTDYEEVYKFLSPYRIPTQDYGMAARRSRSYYANFTIALPLGNLAKIIPSIQCDQIPRELIKGPSLARQLTIFLRLYLRTHNTLPFLQTYINFMQQHLAPLELFASFDDFSTALKDLGLTVTHTQQSFIVKNTGKVLTSYQTSKLPEPPSLPN